jgi:hypothetical protein
MDSLVHIGFGPTIPAPESMVRCASLANRKGAVDTLYFGSAASDSETGEVSGIEYGFEVTTDGVRGGVRRGVGAWGAPLALDSLSRMPGSDSLTFFFTTGGRNLYRGTVLVRCDSMLGIMDYHVVPSGSDSGGGEAFPITEPRLRRPISH